MMSTAPVLVDRATRFNLRVPFQYRKSGMPHWQDAKTINVSRTGILFRAREALAEKSVLDIRLELPLQGTLSCLGTVVRTEGSDCAVRIYRCNLTHQYSTQG
jgi:hypothetical protein